METQPESEKKGMDGLTKVLLGVFVGFPVLLFGGCGILMVVGSGSDSEPGPPSDYEAQMVCEEWVENKLKAPATAEFSNVDASGGPASWTITGAVDAENSFGAQIRNTWTCDIRLDGDTWRGSAQIMDG